MYGIKLLIKGDYACFTRPEMKVERVSYDVPTPSAMRGILESIYWKPAIKWVVDRIYVFNPVQFMNIRRNEMKSKMPLTAVKKQMTDENVDISIYSCIENINQRASLVLRDVLYGVEAHFEMTELEGNDMNKHYAIITRRMKKGQFAKVPVLGCREFPASFEWVDNFPVSQLRGEVDMGYMLYDIKFKAPDKSGNYSECASPIWYRPIMIDGMIDVAKYYEMTGVNK